MKKRIQATAVLLALLTLCACTPVQDMLEQETADLTPPPKDPLDLTDIPDYLSMPLDQLVTPGQYTGLEIRVDALSLSDEQVHSAIREIKRVNGKYQRITDRLVAWGDELVMSYTATVQGAQGTYADKDVWVRLAEDEDFPEEFLRELVGAPCGIPVALTVEEEQAGEKLLVTYNVTVTYIVGEYEELSDTFVSAYTGGACTEADEFFDYYKEQMWNEAYYQQVYDALWEACEKACTVQSVPAEATRYYMDSMEEYYRVMAAQNNVTYEAVLEAFELDEQKMQALAQGYAQKDLIFYAIVKDAGFTLTAEEYDRELHDYATGHFDALSKAVGKGSGENGAVTVADVKAYLDREQRNVIRELCYDRMMYDYLYENNQIFVGDVPMN